MPRPLLLLILLPLSLPACPECGAELRAQVRAALADGFFIHDAAAMLLPFVLIGLGIAACSRQEES